MLEQARLHELVARAEERADGYFFEVSALRSDAIAAEQTLAAIRAEASTAADACAQAIKRDTPAAIIGVALQASGALDRIVLLCDGEADS